MIAEERARQLSQEGWTPEHDDRHTIGELCSAAGAYLFAGDCLANAKNFNDKYQCTPESLTLEVLDGGGSVAWPWEAEWFKVDADPVRNLVKCGALVAAEIDRLLRLRGPGETEDDIAECEIESVRRRLSRYKIENLEWEWLKEGEPYLLKITGHRGDRDAWEEILGPKVSFPIAVDLEWERMCHEEKELWPDLSWPSSGAATHAFSDWLEYLKKRGYSEGEVDGFYEELEKRPWIHQSDDMVLTDTRKAPVPQAEDGGES